MTMKILKKETFVPAPVADVWSAWTTTDGVKTFFAPEAKIELSIDGAYELYFDLEAPAGQQGSEGVTVISYLPEEMLSFNWNAPPDFPEIRKERTWVVVGFSAVDQSSTKVKISHLGWGETKQWDQVYAYFDRAWDIVLSRLKERFEEGPISWKE